MNEREKAFALYKEMFGTLNNDIATIYLSSLMSASLNKNDLDSKRKQVFLLREFFEENEVPDKEHYLRIVDSIEEILGSDDRWIYWRMSFNEQMAWGAEEVEALIRHNHADEVSSRAIRRLFYLVRTDPKNSERLSEIRKAEDEWQKFIHGAKTDAEKEKMLAYWNSFLQAYVEELRQKEGYQ